MNAYIRFISTTIIGISASISSYAQTPSTKTEADTLRRELTVVTDRTINIPTERPLPIRIALKDPILSPLNLSYAEHKSIPNIKTVLIGTRDISPLAEYGFFSPKRGYANLGLGSLLNTRADFGYLLLTNERNRLSFDAHHRSSFDWASEESGEARTRAQAARTNITFDFSHLFDSFAIDLHTGYTHRYHNYYGILDRPEIVQIKPEDYTSADNAHMHSYDIGIGIRSLMYRESRMLYDLRLDFGHTTQRTRINSFEKGLRELMPTLNLSLESYTNESFSLGVRAKGGIVNTDSHDGTPLLSAEGVTRSSKTNFFVQGAPFISLCGGNGSINYKLKAGAGIMFNTGNASKVAFYPLMDASISFADTYRFYLSTLEETGFRPNDLRSIYATNPFLDPRFIIDPSRQLLNARIGFAAGIIPALSLDFYAETKYTAHDYFLALKHLDGAKSDNLADGYRYQLGFTPYYSNSFVWSVGMDLKYNYKGLFGFKLGGRYDKWKLYDATIPAGKPSFVGYATVETNPIDRLRIAMQYQLRAGIKYPNYFADSMESDKQQKIRDAQSLDIRTDYKMNEIFSLYALGSNLLFQRYSDLYGYPARGASVMIGCNINF